jgi:hypothetical protein
MRLLATTLTLLALTASLRAQPGDAGIPHAVAPAIFTHDAPGGPVGDALATTYELVHSGLSLTDRRTVLADGSVARATYLSDGSAVDGDSLRALEHALGLATLGQMSSTLWDRVQLMAPTDTQQVAFWLDEPADGIDLGAVLQSRVAGQPESQLATAVRAARVEVHVLAVARYAPGNQLFAELVVARGASVDLVGDIWPFVIATATAEQIRSLAADPTVDEAYLSMPVWEPEGDFAQGTLRTPIVWGQGVSADGSANVLVNDTAQVQIGNIYLPTVIPLNISSAASHATGVAGNICNIHPVYMAAANAIPTIFTAGGSGDTAAPPIWSNAILEGADFGNCSWWNFLKGQIEFLDRFFDHTIRNFSVMMFKSNGNQGTSGTPYGTTPGQGYNVTCSGAYSDNNNVAWPGDAMASSSSYWNPLEGHEKPELASPGTGVNTAGTGGSGIQTGFGGTSSASPLTCGVATLIASADNTLLSQMTTVKALLMASAWHNIEGNPLVSDRDGAGGVHTAAAWAAVRDGQWWYDDVEAGDFSSAGGSPTLDISIELDAGDDVRVCALWFSNPDASYSTDVLDMDLDMTVLDPLGDPVAASTSTTNPFELAFVRNAVGGTYTVRLTQQRFDGVSEPLSVVWSTRSDTATATVDLAGGSADFAIGNNPTLLFEEAFEGAGRTYISWAALAGAPGVPMGAGFTLPIASDFLTPYSLGLPGFFGTLDGAGQATASFPLPNNLNIVGLEIHFATVVLGASGQLNDIYTVSTPRTLTIGS